MPLRTSSILSICIFMFYSTTYKTKVFEEKYLTKHVFKYQIQFHKINNKLCLKT